MATAKAMIDIPSRPALRRKDQTSGALVQIRTIHSQSVSTLNHLHASLNRTQTLDPDIREMIDCLHKVELLLAPWARKQPKIPAPLVPLPTREEILADFIR